jgi:hypothetical protein
MLKPYSELVKVDVLPFCEKREAQNDKKQKIEVPYLNWAKCVDLLHEHGAEVVYFEPCVNANGSSLFMTEQTFGSKEYTHRCYEVRVKIVIDDLVFEVQHPLMNGANPVKDNSLDQRRIWTAQTRAFVKGVAIRTGLGFNLWIKHGDESEDKTQPDDLSSHSIFAIRERMQQQCTALVKKGMTTKEIAQKIGINEQSLLQYYLGGVFDEIHRVEAEMSKL